MLDNIGSIIFNLAYLLIVWIALVLVLVKNRGKEKTAQWKWVFASFFLLGFGDIFHLLTRTYVFFKGTAENSLGTIYGQSDIISLLGFGLIATSITAQLFYLGLYFYWRDGEKKKLQSSPNHHSSKKPFLFLDSVMVVATVLRMVLVAHLSQNMWGAQLEAPNLFRYLTNAPLYVAGIVCVVLFSKRALTTGYEKIEGFSSKDRKMVKNVVIWMLVSFITYSITLFFSWENPIAGMAMIPKTIAYLIMLLYFYKGLLVKR